MRTMAFAARNAREIVRDPLSALFGMNGVWSAFPAAEAITLALTVFLLKRPQSVCG